MSAVTATSAVWGDESRVDAKVKVLIADDHPLLLAGLRRTMEGDGGIEIVGEARSGPEVIALVGRRMPDVVLLDLRMPGTTGADCIEEIHRTWPEIKCIVLSAETDPVTVDAALNAGACAYIVKSVAPTDIPAVVRQVAGGAVFHARPAPAASGPGQCAPEGAGLTDRERSILSAVAEGKTTSVISRELWVSEHTIKFHLTNIYRKLGVRNRAAAIKYALENGLA
jgi:DNA-binding NarL/FixJ family response regulator